MMLVRYLYGRLQIPDTITLESSNPSVAANKEAVGRSGDYLRERKQADEQPAIVEDTSLVPKM